MYQDDIHPSLPSQLSGSKRHPDPAVMSHEFVPKWEVQKTESWEILRCSTSLYSGGANSLLMASKAEPNCQLPSFWFFAGLFEFCFVVFFYSNWALPVLPSAICSSCCSPAPALGTNLQRVAASLYITVDKKVLLDSSCWNWSSSLRSARQLDRYHGRTTYADTLQLNPPP